MVSSRQYEPPSPLASAEEGGGGREKGWGLIPDLAFTATTVYNWSQNFFHIIGEQWFFLTTRSYAPLLSPIGGSYRCDAVFR